MPAAPALAFITWNVDSAVSPWMVSVLPSSVSRVTDTSWPLAASVSSQGASVTRAGMSAPSPSNRNPSLNVALPSSRGG